MTKQTLRELIPLSLWGFLVLFVNFLVSNAIFLAAIVLDFVSLGRPASGFASLFSDLAQTQMKKPNVVSWSVIGGAFASLLCLFVVLLLKKGTSIASYLAFHRAKRRQFLIWFVIYFVFFCLIEVIGHYAKRPPIPEFMQILVCAPFSHFLLFVAVAVAAPLFEEFFFRGFLFQGLLDAKTGVLAAIFVPNLIWTAIHFQYDIYDLSQVFLMGLILGAARYFSSSISVPLFLHIFQNTVALSAAFYLRDCSFVS